MKENKTQSSKTINKGFTLIELLVVVLIIGILAAIALPQYRKAVRKSRAAEAKIVLKAIIDANDRYILTTGETTADLNKLDIEVPTESKNWVFYIDECVCDSERVCGCYAGADSRRGDSYSLWLASEGYDQELGNKITCYACDEESHQICRSLGSGEVAQVWDETCSDYLI